MKAKREKEEKRRKKTKIKEASLVSEVSASCSFCSNLVRSHKASKAHLVLHPLVQRLLSLFLFLRAATIRSAGSCWLGVVSACSCSTRSLLLSR